MYKFAHRSKSYLLSCAAMVLTAIHGVSPNEAAEIESCSVSTMHWRIHEARKQLRHRLKEYVNTEDGEQ